MSIRTTSSSSSICSTSVEIFSPSYALPSATLSGSSSFASSIVPSTTHSGFAYVHASSLLLSSPSACSFSSTITTSASTCCALMWSHTIMCHTKASVMYVFRSFVFEMVIRPHRLTRFTTTHINSVVSKLIWKPCANHWYTDQKVHSFGLWIILLRILNHCKISSFGPYFTVFFTVIYLKLGFTCHIY
jgi:hypothetical protein